MRRPEVDSTVPTTTGRGGGAAAAAAAGGAGRSETPLSSEEGVTAGRDGATAEKVGRPLIRLEIDPTGFALVRHKYLPGGFLWDNIPGFAVITGVNGSGKTSLLEAILLGYEQKRTIKGTIYAGGAEDATMIKIAPGSFRVGLPHIFSFSSVSNSSMLFSVDEASRTEYDRKLDLEFEDLKRYDTSKKYGTEYASTVSDELRADYEGVLSSYEKPAHDPSKDYSSVFYDRLKRHFKNTRGVHSSVYGKVDKYFDHLLLCGFDIEKLRDFLIEKGFKHRLLVEEGRRDKTLEFLNSTGVGGPIPWSALSPGEQLELLTLFWLFESNIIKKSDSGSIMLLDEPDAHLHPRLIHDFVNTIKNRLVGELGIQVIMTTHNPTTVSLCEKDSVFIMSADDEGKSIIKPCVNKRQAIQLLTEDFVCVNEPIKLVFVEGDDDKTFYELIMKKLVAEGVIAPEVQLLFKAHGTIRRKDPSKEDSDRATVERLVRLCSAEAGLTDFIYGLVDSDNHPPSSEAVNLFAIERYSMENYIYDPINFFFLMITSRKQNTEPFKLIYSSVCAEFESRGIPMPNSFKALEESSIKDKAQLLQKIIDETSVVFMNQLQDRINKSREKSRAKSRATGEDSDGSIARLTQPKTNLIQDDGNSLVDEVTEVHYQGVCLHYPNVLIKMRGHDLADEYNRVFKLEISTESIMKIFNERGIFISDDLVDVFKKLLHLVPKSTASLSDAAERLNLTGAAVTGGGAAAVAGVVRRRAADLLPSLGPTTAPAVRAAGGAAAAAAGLGSRYSTFGSAGATSAVAGGAGTPTAADAAAAVSSVLPGMGASRPPT